LKQHRENMKTITIEVEDNNWLEVFKLFKTFPIRIKDKHNL